MKRCRWAPLAGGIILCPLSLVMKRFAFLALCLALGGPLKAQTICDASGCTLPDHLGDLQIMVDFMRRSGMPIRQGSCPKGVLGVFRSSPQSTGSMTICNAAFSRGAQGVRETLQHEMVHAAQFCKARNNGKRGFWTISSNREQIIQQSQQVGVYRHSGGAYGMLSEHEAYTHENARPRDVLYWFNKYCIERKK